MNTKRTQLQLHNINIITVPKLRYRAHDPKIDPSPAFHKSLKLDNVKKLCL